MLPDVQDVVMEINKNIFTASFSFAKKLISFLYKGVRKIIRDRIIFIIRFVLRFTLISDILKKIINSNPRLYRKLEVMANPERTESDNETWNFINKTVFRFENLSPGAKKIYYDIKK